MKRRAFTFEKSEGIRKKHHGKRGHSKGERGIEEGRERNRGRERKRGRGEKGKGDVRNNHLRFLKSVPELPVGDGGERRRGGGAAGTVGLRDWQQNILQPKHGYILETGQHLTFETAAPFPNSRNSQLATSGKFKQVQGKGRFLIKVFFSSLKIR